MPGTLALVGGGEWGEECAFDRDLLDAAGTTEVVVLATAAAYELPAEHERRAAEHFARLGAQVRALPVYGRSDALQAEHADAVASARFLYLSSGASLHFVSVMKATPVWEALVGAWQAGAVVAASEGSARALADPMVDPRGGAFTLGLGLLPGLAFVPHRDSWSHDRATRTRELAPRGVPLAVVDAGTAIVRGPGGTWSVGGAGDVSVFVDNVEVGLDALP
jgi:cyanophycinase